MACGIPVILAANTGVKDVIDGGNCIALTKQKPIHDFTECGTEQWGESDVEEIVQALERLYADSSYRHKMGRDGAAWILGQGPHLGKSCAAVEISDIVALKPYRRSGPLRQCPASSFLPATIRSSPRHVSARSSIRCLASI